MLDPTAAKRVDLIYDVIQKKGPITLRGLTNYIHLAEKDISMYVRDLRKANMIYVSDWIKGYNNRFIMTFSAGRRIDAPRPPMLDQAIRRQEKKREESAAFVPRPDVAAAWMFNGQKQRRMASKV
jgi:hypothetical protein